MKAPFPARCRSLLVVAGFLLAFGAPALPVRAQTSPDDQQFRALYQELVEINTTHSVGDTGKAAEAMAAHLRAAGYPDADIFLGANAPRKGNLVARLHGTGKHKPILLLAHIDVVEAKREDWSVDPFKLLEKDGYFYGRGSVDDKAMAAIFADMMVRFKKEGFVPNRDLILALTTDEESGASSPANGVRWLIANHKDLIDAEFGLNEGGGGEMRKGKLLVTRVQTSEKVAMNYALTVTNPGGHSSLPRKDNAITRLSAALVKVGAFDFPFSLNETTKLYLERGAQLQTGQLADDMRAAAKGDGAAAGRLSADPFNNSILHTTCVATMLQGGHAANALPQLARAVVNCRILPGESAEEVRQTLVKVVGDDKVVVTAETPFTPSPASALKPEIMEPIETLSKEMFPTALVIPAMSTGATDSRWLRQIGMPMYGVSGLYTDADDVRVHGRDERIGVKDLFAGREFLYRLVKAYSTGN